MFIVVDEAFIDFVEKESVKALVRQNAYLIVLRSLTKYYALPGFGSAIFSVKLAESRSSPLIGNPGPSTLRP